MTILLMPLWVKVPLIIGACFLGILAFGFFALLAPFIFQSKDGPL